VENNMRKPTLTIHRGWTHAAITILQSCPAASGIGNFIRNSLVEKEYLPEHNEFINGRWRKVWGRWQDKYKYYRYDGKSQKLFIPIAFADDIVVVAKSLGLDVEEKRINDYELRKIDVKMNPNFSDQDHQVELIKKCSDPTPGMRGLAMQTGRGKTYSAIKSWVNLGYVGIVIVDGLMDQWIESIRKFTNCDKDYIYKLQEFNSLAMLAQNPNYKPSIFVASLKTLQLFCNGKDGYELLPWNFTEFFTFYGIGVKIIDEVHRSFHATTMMDLKTNVPYSMYASATFTQSSKQARTIFNKVYPRSIQYGMDAYDKYVECYVYAYSGTVHAKKCVRGNRGYQHTRYEKELMISESKLNAHLNDLIYPIFNQHFINRYKPGYKSLIFCASIDFVEALATKLSKKYPSMKVITYVGGDEMSVLKDADIVVSTRGKSSTGLDLPGLIMALNLVSTVSEVSIMQSVGRLRKRNDIKLHYVDVYDTNIERQIEHAEVRKTLLKSMCSKYFEYNGMCDLSVQNGNLPKFI
jgi:superfamily II DNA or RNA helicase